MFHKASLSFAINLTKQACVHNKYSTKLCGPRKMCVFSGNKQ